MDIRTEQLLEGAGRATGTTVIIDVFRASSTITLLYANGAEVLPVVEIDTALAKKEETGFPLLAERDREKIDGADFGNSPSTLEDKKWNGKTVILSTTAGTKGIRAAEDANEVLIGCFLNAEAICEYIKNEQPETVTLVAIGKNGKESALEDTFCARYLRARLEDKNPDFNEMKRVLTQTEAAQELHEGGNGMDIPFCLREDVFDVVPQFDPERERIAAITS